MMDELKEIKGYPPNFELIKTLGLAKEGNIYCYGQVIFNPSGGEIPSDIKYHEHIHSQEQGNDPMGWWNHYLLESSFRLNEELKAYSAQYKLIKKSLRDKDAKDFLEEMAHNLSTLYKLDITKEQAATLIRKHQ